MTRIFALTPGDPEGIGPEVTWKAIRSRDFRKDGIHILCVGAENPFRKLRCPIELAKLDRNGGLTPPPARMHPFVWLLPAPEKSKKLLPGFQSGWSIETATRLVLAKKASAIVTGPISKERLNQGGYHYAGHTEFLAELCGRNEVTMMLANDILRVSLVTTHVAIKDVSKALTRAKIRQAVLDTADSLRKHWRIRKPRIAVAALNPHAGESGMFGKEEIRTISPEIRALSAKHRHQFSLFGPLPADTLFANHSLAPKNKRFDAVVCMYHDQGLIPVKLLDFHHTVNVTLGLPIIRTSVDHGVGFDIAGTGKANPSSMISAIELAAQMTRK